MKPNDIYMWEMETTDGTVLRQYDDDGQQHSWKDLNPLHVVRVTFLPKISTLPTHNVFIDHSQGEQFIRRFARGFIKQTPDGFKLKEYVNCCVTNRYRLWVFCNGACMVTHKNYEVRI